MSGLTKFLAAMTGVSGVGTVASAFDDMMIDSEVRDELGFYKGSIKRLGKITEEDIKEVESNT